MRRTLTVLAALLLLVPASSAIITQPGNQPQGILESLTAVNDGSGSNTSAKNFGVTQVDSKVKWHERPEFKATIQLWNNGTQTANDYQKLTYEVPDKNVLDSVDTANTWIEDASGNKYAFDSTADTDGDGYIELERTTASTFQSVGTGNKVNVTIHFQMPKVSVTRTDVDELSDPKKKQVTYNIGSSEFHDYTDAVIQLSPPDFEDTIGGVSWTQDGDEVGVSVDTDAGTITHTETVSNQSESATVEYMMPVANPGGAEQPAPVQAPTPGTVSQQALNFVQGLLTGVLSIFGL